MTLNGIMAVMSRYFTKIGTFGPLGPITSQWSKIDLYSLDKKCSLMKLVFSDIPFMVIFAEVTENERIIERHLHPLLDYDTSESQSTLSI